MRSPSPSPSVDPADPPGPVGAPVGRRIHFVADVDPAEVETWDPDREPERHVSGVGHQLVELWARLRDRGRPVTIGPRPPCDALLVGVLFDLVRADGSDRVRAALRLDRDLLRSPRLVVILGDHPRPDRVPPFARSVIVPNPSGADGRTRRWLPLLPQRGMVPRRSDRRGAARTLVLKTGERNVPEEYRDPQFARTLERLGVSLTIEDGPSTWPDFGNADLVLCVHRPWPGWDPDHRLARKPPTKLINAWVAGSVPLVHPQVGYLDLARPGEDALVVASPADVVAAVGRLHDDPDLLARLEDGAAVRGREFATDRVLERWESDLWGHDHRVGSRRSVTRHAATVALGAVRRRARG